MRSFLLTILFSIAASAMVAQIEADTSRRWNFSIAPHYGFIVPHTNQVVHLIQGHSYGAYFGAYKRVSGKRPWHHEYNLPEQGIGLTYIYTGNKRQLGEQIAVNYMLDLPVDKRPVCRKRISGRPMKIRNRIGLGLGLGYITKDWDLETNHQAAVIGSKVNISLALQYSRQIASFGDSQLRAGIRISHFSNGAFQLPNLGTNNASLFISYHYGKRREIFATAPKIKVEKKNKFTVGGFFGLKEIPPPYGKKYLVLSGSLLGERRISFKSSFGLGLDYFYNTSLVTMLERKEEKIIPASKAMQAGVVFSYALHFDDFVLMIQQGVYVHDNWQIDGLFYHRFGLRYSITKHLFTQLTLKTHFAKADFGEFGVGYTF